MGKTLSNINHSRILYDLTPRILEIKAKINKWDLIKFKIFCTTKETISKVKRQPPEWEKIIVNEATDKELISKIYKQLLKLSSVQFSSVQLLSHVRLFETPRITAHHSSIPEK